MNENNVKFCVKGRVIIEDFITEAHKDNICYLLTSLDGIEVNEDDMRRVENFPGMNNTVHVVITKEEVNNLLLDMDTYDYVSYIMDECKSDL